ncbi:MAG TPA: hypothetical protein VMU65_11110 [Candidatus Saccharimonadales bacterium]|nr:hypothetical protein [Candidatus Saccharimonadales bacterium]
MSEQDVFVLADHALNRVVEQITDDQWDMRMPASFARSGDAANIPSLRTVIAYHAYDDAWVPDMLAGRTMEEAEKAKFDGDLLGAHPKASFGAIVDKACAAAIQMDDLDRTVHCSFGDFPAREYFWQINMFRGLRAWDIARVIGVDPTLPDGLVQGLWDELSPVADGYRQYGVFPAAVPVPDDAPLMQRLLGLTGRDPE